MSENQNEPTTGASPEIDVEGEKFGREPAAAEVVIPKSYGLLTSEDLQRVLSRTSEHSFAFNIQRMNAMYKLPILTVPSLAGLTKPNGVHESASARIKGFIRTLRDEVQEGDEILFKLMLIERQGYDSATPFVSHEQLVHELEERTGVVLGSESLEKVVAFSALVFHDIGEATKDVLVDIADWTGDIMVYCRSEAMKFGLPTENVLEAIMGSNFTKLSADGVPKHDENGKFLKDMTRFVPPEPAIKTMLFGLAPEPTVDADGNVKPTTSETVQAWFNTADDGSVKMSDNVFHDGAAAKNKDTGFVD